MKFKERVAAAAQFVGDVAACTAGGMYGTVEATIAVAVSHAPDSRMVGMFQGARVSVRDGIIEKATKGEHTHASVEDAMTATMERVFPNGIKIANPLKSDEDDSVRVTGDTQTVAMAAA